MKYLKLHYRAITPVIHQAYLQTISLHWNCLFYLKDLPAQGTIILPCYQEPDDLLIAITASLVRISEYRRVAISCTIPESISKSLLGILTRFFHLNGVQIDRAPSGMHVQCVIEKPLIDYGWAVVLLNVLIAVTAWILISPLLLVALIQLGLLFRKSIIFAQYRPGRFMKPYRLFKLRTMADNRIVPAALWIRLSRVDESPQLLQILNGEMSFVGPRPEIYTLFETLVGWNWRYSCLWLFKPGILSTGIARYSGIYDAKRLKERAKYYFASFINRYTLGIAAIYWKELTAGLELLAKEAIHVLSLLSVCRIQKIFRKDQ